MISILVANSKGGCGKTTIATHLAAAFAVGGLRTALADTDRQRSSLTWAKQRPEGAAPITVLDWRTGIGKLDKKTDRLVIDAPAGLTRAGIRELVALADSIVVPVLPSALDEAATARFLAKLEELKPIRKNRKPVAVIRNRVKPRTRAESRLDRFVAGLDYRDVGRLVDRSVYSDLAAQGLSIFDLTTRRIERIAPEWVDLVRYVENADTAPAKAHAPV